MNLQELNNYLASRRFEERYPNIDTYGNAYLGLSAPASDEDNNGNDKGVKRRRWARRKA
jgi:hypothetical protein